MVDFRQGYVPPGVYVTADTSAVTSAVGASPTVVLLVGPGLGSRSLVDHASLATKTSSFVLSGQGVINPGTGGIVVSSTSNGVKTTYALTTDYTVATTGSGSTAVTTVTGVNSGGIPTATQIDFAYAYADSAYFPLNQFSDFSSLTSVYGAPFSSSGTLQSALSLAAQIAFDNGANTIYCVAIPNGVTGSSLSDAYRAAYDLSMTNFDINLIVPVFDGQVTSGHPIAVSSLTAFISGLNAHLQNAEAQGYPRNAILSVPETFDNTVTPDQIATSIAYRRVMLVWPNKLYFYNAFSSPPGTLTIGGSYLAAACAGIVANNPTVQGLTKRQVYSIAGIDATIASAQTTTNKNTWSSRGVAVLEANRLGQLTIRHGVTTDVSAITNREFSIVRCQDELFTEVQASLEAAALIGTPITADTPLAVKSIVGGALETAKSNDTIFDYANLAVRQQTLPNGDPTVIEVVFSYQPTYPLNYITVTFSFDLSTGTITSDTSDTSSVNVGSNG